MEELGNMDKEELLQRRKLKFRYIGGFQEGMAVEPERKRSMKLSEVNKPKTDDIELEPENLKKQILESGRPVNSISNEAIEKLKEDVDQGITSAFISMGLQEKLESVKLELSKAPNRLPNQPLNRNLKEKIEKIMEEFKHNLSRPGAYLGLKHKLGNLNTVHRILELKDRSEKLKAEINQKIPEEVKAKTGILKNAKEKLSNGDSLDKESLEEVVRAKKELLKALESSGLQVVGISRRNSTATAPPSLQQKLESMNKRDLTGS